MKNKKYIFGAIIIILVLIILLGIYLYSTSKNKTTIISKKVSKVIITIPDNNSDDADMPTYMNSDFIYDEDIIEYLTNIVNNVGDEYTEFYQYGSDYGEGCTSVNFYLENGEKIQITTSDFYSEKEDGTKFNIMLVSFLDDWSADDYSNYKVYEAEIDLATKIQQCYK